MRSPSWRRSWKLGRTRCPNLKTQQNLKVRPSQKTLPTRLSVLAGSCHPSAFYASAMLRNIACSSARAPCLLSGSLRLLYIDIFYIFYVNKGIKCLSYIYNELRGNTFCNTKSYLVYR